MEPPFKNLWMKPKHVSGQLERTISIGEIVNDLCCPSCLSYLRKGNGTLTCISCGKEYPIVAGIPDLRLFAPIEDTLENDLKEALHLASLVDHVSFERLVRENAKISKEKVKRPNELIDLYTQMSLSAEQRELNRFKELDFLIKKYGLPSAAPDCALDLGTGMGPALPQLAERFNHVIAVDISLKHLIMARKRCEEKGYRNITYVCGCSEKLPCYENSFSFVNSADVLEHVSNSKTYLKEIERVLNFQSMFWASTPNRFSILPEGHVMLWGVGFLPRVLQKYYVGLMRKTNYKGIRPVSYIELSRLLRSVFKHYQIILPVDIYEIVEPHPGIEPSPLWRIARGYWKFVNKHQTIRRLGNSLEKAFYPQFRFFAIKI